MFRRTHSDPDTQARCGVLSLPHGDVETPAFMPVGTAGTVKAVPHSRLEALGFNLILGNTYHLYLRPGLDTIDSFRGLHAFSSWNGNILTDSGGYQVFSLAPFRKIHSNGVAFQSHIDGSRHKLTPEGVVDIQVGLNSDVQMALDVCTAYGASRDEAAEASETTSRWATLAKARWLSHRRGPDGGERSERSQPRHYRGSLFGIVQGNFFEDLRRESAAELTELDFPGYAIGGLSVGEPSELFTAFVASTAELLPVEKLRYVMGIGTPDYVLAAVEHGVDMFDCVFPTRAGRNGTVLTRQGRLALKNAKHRLDPEPIEEGCDCSACLRYSRGYLRHLFKAGEILGPVLATEHNLAFMKRLTDGIRRSIQEGAFSAFKRDFLRDYER